MRNPIDDALNGGVQEGVEQEIPAEVGAQGRLDEGVGQETTEVLTDEVGEEGEERLEEGDRKSVV